MKHYIFAATVLIFCCFGCHAQTAEQNNHHSGSPANYPAFYIEGSGTYIYSHAIGKKPVCYIDSLEHISYDICYEIELIKKSARRFYVRIYNIYSPEALAWYGWIDRSVLEIVFSQRDMELFRRPRNTSGCTKLTVPEGTIAHVADFRKDGWMKVSFTANDSSYTGWLPPEYQCNNPCPRQWK